MKRSYLQIALYLLAVFVSGVIVGAFGQRLYMVKDVRAAQQRRSPEEYRKKYVEDLRTRLQLNADQESRLNKVLDETNDRFKVFRESHKAEMDSIHQEQVRQIDAMLSVSQQAEYKKFREEREKRRREAEGRR